MWAAGDRIKLNGVPGTITDVRTPFSAYFHLENGTCGEALNELYERDTDMGRPRKTAIEKKAEAEKNDGTSLAAAIKFCAPGYKENGESYSTHAMLYGGWLTTYDGVLMFGHPIKEQVSAAPNFGQLRAAILATAGQATSITQLDAARLSVKSGKFRAVVQCITDPYAVARHAVDPAVGALDSRMREGFEIMKQIASKTGEHVLTSSVLVYSGGMVATDRTIISEFHHGLGFPTLPVPSQFVEAVLKVPKSLVSFGFSERSVTFYYEDGSFIRSQLYAEDWPDVSKVLPTDFSKLKPVPAGFFEAMLQLKPFTDRSYVLCDEGVMRTHDEPDVGASTDVAGLEEAPAAIDHVRLLPLSGRISHIDYTSDDERTTFYGENLRGVCMNYKFDRDDKPTPEEVAYEGERTAALAPPATTSGGFGPPGQ